MENDVFVRKGESKTGILYSSVLLSLFASENHFSGHRLPISPRPDNIVSFPILVPRIYVYETVACPGFPFPKTKVKHYFLGRLRNASSPSLISKSKSGNGTRSLIRSLKWHHSIFWSMQIRARSFSADKRTSRKNNFLFLLPVNLFRQAFRFVRKFDRPQFHIFTSRSICLR